MKTIISIVITTILLATNIYSLIRCPDFKKVKRSSRFQPMSVMCDTIAQEKYAESYVYYIKANFTTETCTYSPLTKAFISPKVIIAADSKIIYRRGPESHTIRPPCLPERAEYLTGDVYLLIERIPHPTDDMFELEESFKDAACTNFLNEAANINSGNSTYEEKLKFIRRVTAYDGLIGDIKDGRIHWVKCDIIDLPVANKTILQSDCFYGAMIETYNGNFWYSRNGLDIDDKEEVEQCIYSHSLIIKRSISFNNGSEETKSTYLDDCYNGSLSTRLFKFCFFGRKLAIIHEALLELTSAQLATIVIILSVIIIFMMCCFCCAVESLHSNANKRHGQRIRRHGSHVSYV
uniref:Glycoprotein n=1 Tax=Strongyloides papillosus TaxID=174720 RepID=A0A0N5B298_STREA